MQPQTSTALCINTPLVLSAGPESAKLYRSSVRCPQSTGSQHQAGLDRCLSHCARRSCLSHYGGTWSWWLLETRPWSWCPPLTICCAVRVCTCLDVQPCVSSGWELLRCCWKPRGKLPRAPRACRTTLCHPVPFCSWRLV